MIKTTREEVLRNRTSIPLQDCCPEYLTGGETLTSDKRKSDKDQDGFSLSKMIALVLAAVRLLIELLA